MCDDPLHTASSDGHVVQVLHHFGDALWEFCGGIRPVGYIDGEVVPLRRHQLARLQDLQLQHAARADRPKGKRQR